MRSDISIGEKQCLFKRAPTTSDTGMTMTSSFMSGMRTFAGSIAVVMVALHDGFVGTSEMSAGGPVPPLARGCRRRVLVAGVPVLGDPVSSQHGKGQRHYL